MEYQANLKLPKPLAPRLRRAPMMFLAFVYLFVGLTHTTSCVDEAFAATRSVDLSAASADGPDDAKKSVAVAEHCYVCAPVLMPALAPLTDPSAQPAKLAFLAPRLLLLEDHPRLDTPPPKHLI